jgi:peptide/nickel transport system substrate-binding protein
MTLKKTLTTGLVATGMALTAGAASAQDLRIGLQEDPDALDPDLARTFVGRIVFASLCDKLIDIDPDLNFVPMLATEWSWSDDGLALTMELRDDVVFHDGEPFNAEAAKVNIERSLNLPGSTRRSEISEVESVDVLDDYTVRLNLAEPFSPLLAALSDRAGMMISPKAAEEAGEDFANDPVCSGPFRFVERVAQDRIVLERFEDYYRADEIHFDSVTFLPIPDTTVRLASLQSGDLHLIERVAASDLSTVEQAPDLRLEQATELGYIGITTNLNNTERANNPLGQDPRVREALELAIDRNALNQVAFEGNFLPGNQPVSPENPYYIKSMPMAERDVERARALLQEAGHERVSVEFMVANDPVQMRVAQVIQAMAGEVGFDLQIDATEFASALNRQTAGDFEAFLIGWSGRVDPDGNIHLFAHTDGALNDGKYSNPEVDAALDAARRTGDFEERYTYYEEAAEHYLADRPRIYLYHRKWFWGLTDRLEGFVPYPDGMIRPQGMSLS